MEFNRWNFSWSLNGRNVLLQSPSFKFSRKASSSYSLKLEPPSKQKTKAKRKPLSTPASPSRTREPQCTCMTTEQYARLRAQDTRYKGRAMLLVCFSPNSFLLFMNHTWNYITEDDKNTYTNMMLDGHTRTVCHIFCKYPSCITCDCTKWWHNMATVTMS